jgi:hypothetical protein
MTEHYDASPVTVGFRLDDPDLDRYRTESQKEWARWAAHGYRKRYQPRSVLWFGGIFFTLFAIGLGTLFWLVATGRWP